MHPLGDREIDCRLGIVEDEFVPFGNQQMHDLGHEKRIPLCLPVQGGDKSLSGGHAGSVLDKAGDILLGEPFEENAPGHRLTRQFS
jgi:hypothetical protein